MQSIPEGRRECRNQYAIAKEAGVSESCVPEEVELPEEGGCLILLRPEGHHFGEMLRSPSIASTRQRVSQTTGLREIRLKTVSSKVWQSCHSAPLLGFLVSQPGWCWHLLCCEDVFPALTQCCWGAHCCLSSAFFCLQSHTESHAGFSAPSVPSLFIAVQVKIHCWFQFTGFYVSTHIFFRGDNEMLDIK